MTTHSERADNPTPEAPNVDPDTNRDRSHRTHKKKYRISSPERLLLCLNENYTIYNISK